MGLGRFVSSGLSLKFTPLRLMVVSAILCTLVTAGLILVPVLWGAWLLFALSGIFVACFWPTLLAIASDHISSGCTSLFSLLSAAGVTGCIVVPWAIGALGDLIGLRLAMLVLPSCTVLLLIVLQLASRYFHQPPADLPAVVKSQ
jgi:fucose permease